MSKEVASILAEADPSIYLYGYVAVSDYKHGLSDIDLIVVTKYSMTFTTQTLLWQWANLLP